MLHFVLDMKIVLVPAFPEISFDKYTGFNDILINYLPISAITHLRNFGFMLTFFHPFKLIAVKNKCLKRMILIFR